MKTYVDFYRCVAGLLIAAAMAASADAAYNETRLLAASGIPPEQVEQVRARLDQLAGEFRAQSDPGAGHSQQTAALHAFLHRRVLRGTYQASASELGPALDGGPFNCVAATLLFCLVGERAGLQASAMSTRGHVWCRIEGDGGPIDVETTYRDWFAILAKYQGLPDHQVSAGMAKHRRRVTTGRKLDDARLLAVLHFNRGVTRIREQQLPAAAWENLQAVALDPNCQPARENLAAVAQRLRSQSLRLGDFHGWLIHWAIERAVAGDRVLAVN